MTAPAPPIVVALLLASACVSACEEDSVPAPSRVTQIVTSLTPGQGWESLSDEDRAYLEDRASATLEDYRTRWGASALETYSRDLLNQPAGSPALQAFDAAFRVRFRSRLAAPDTFAASTDISQADLREALIRLHIVHLAARRINAVRYDGLANVDWRGTGPIQEFPLPDPEAMSAQRDFAAEVEASLAGLEVQRFTDEERAIRDRAVLYARQLATGSTGFRFGGRDFETVWGVGQWSWDLMCNMSEACFGLLWGSEEAFIDTVNAWFFGPLRWVDSGAISGLDFALSSSNDWSEITRLLGNPETTPTALAYLRLVDLWEQRVRSLPEAEKACTTYSNEDQASAWRSFTAENLLYPELDGSLEGLNSDVTAFITGLREQQKGFVIAIVTAMVAGGEASQDALSAVTTELAALDEGSLQRVLNTGFSAIATVDSSAAGRFKQTLESLETVGGAGDEPRIQAMWDEVTAWVVNRYFGGDPINPATGETYLPDDLTLLPSGGALTTADGDVQMGISGILPPTTYYRVMLHEAHHSILARQGAFPEGASWEGAALVAEMQLLPIFLEETWKDHPQYGGMTDHYLAAEWLSYQYLLAGTQATLESWVRDSCAPDAQTLVSEYATTWDVPDELVETLVERVYQGLNYVQYVAEGVGYRLAMDALQQSVGDGTVLDPYILIACGIGLVDTDASTQQALQACLN